MPFKTFKGSAGTLVAVAVFVCILSPCPCSPCRLGPVAARWCVCGTESVCWECVHYVCVAGSEAGLGVEPGEVWQPAGTSCGAPRVRWDAERQAARRRQPRQ